MIRRLWPLPLLVFGLLAVVPMASAAPTVLPTSSALVFVDNDTDLFVFPDWQNAGSTTTVTAPNGAQLIVTSTGTATSVLAIPVPPCVNSGTGRFLVIKPDGTLISSAGATPIIQGNLVGVPADGTWTVTISYGAQQDALAGGLGPYCQQIGGKSFELASGGIANNRHSCFYNWHIAGTTYRPANCGAADAEQDANDFVFYSDQAPPDDNPDSFTGQSVVGCPNTVTVNGVWNRGSTQTLNTFAGFYHVQGATVADQDLRDNLGVTNTGYVDKGGGAEGTHSATIGYNNAAGNSYQLAVKNGTGGSEQLGAVLFVAPGQCEITGLAGALALLHNEILVDITASQAQCNGDQTSFSIDTDLTTLISLSDLDVDIIRTNDGVVLLEIDKAEMLTANANQIHFFNRTLPPGSYLAWVRADLGGIGAVDAFDSAAFNVPLGTCIDTPADFGPTNSLIRFESNQTNTYVNNTNTSLHEDHVGQGLYPHCQNTTAQVGDCQGIHANLTEVHTHIDQHFDNITAFLSDLCSGGGNCTFFVNNTGVIDAIEAQNMTIIELAGYTDAEVGGILLFGALLVWALWRRWWFVAGCASFGFLANVSHLPSQWTIVSLLFLFLAYWLEMWAVNSKAGDAPKDT